MRLTRVRPSQVLLVFVLLGILCLVTPVAVARAESQAQSDQCNGYYYTVKLGDTWTIIARRVGLPIAALKAANPQAVRPRELIYAGERLCIPSQTGGGVEQGGYWYQVKPGDTWNKVSRATGVPVQQLMAANPGLVNRRQWLFLGQRVWVPTAAKDAVAATVTPTALPTSTPTPTAVGPAQPVTLPTETVTASPTPLPTGTPTAPPPPAQPSAVPAAPQATATPTAAPLASPVATGPTPTLPPMPADCPKTLAGYGDAIGTYLNKAGNTPAKLQEWLVACRAAGPESVTAGPKAEDAVVVIRDPAPSVATPKGQLLVYHKGAKGYTLAHKHEGQGQIELVQAADVNADGKFDLVYSDSSCGAHTCFGTLFVDSWDGKTYADWISDSPTIADPEYTVKEAAVEGQGSEIQVHGGVIGSVGAGPQRAWTETYISSDGEPYILFSQVYDPSTCLYHKILDANQAFDAWALDGFDPAIEAYKAAVANQAATACGSIKDEVATLRDFARFRLIVADVAAGRATEGLPLANEIRNTALHGAATTFLNSYRTNGSVIQACRDTTKYAQSTPAAWQFLADWGYANPSFTSGDLCPLN